MNAVLAACLLAVVATVSGTQVVSTIGGSQLYYAAPSALSSGYQYQYVAQPSHYQYVAHQPVVSSSNVVSSSVPVTYASSAVLPSTYAYSGYPYALNYGYGYLKK